MQHIDLRRDFAGWRELRCIVYENMTVDQLIIFARPIDKSSLDAPPPDNPASHYV